jgi:hypothetical protein
VAIRVAMTFFMINPLNCLDGFDCVRFYCCRYYLVTTAGLISALAATAGATSLDSLAV